MDNYTNLNRDVSAINNLTRFNGFLDNRYLDPHLNGYAFVFITKPSLFIQPYSVSDNSEDQIAFENMKRDPKFAKFLDDDALSEEDRIIPRLLSYKHYNDVPNFIVPFTNLVEGFDPVDSRIDTEEEFQTKQGFKLSLPTHKTQSEAGGDLTLIMKETANTDLTKILELWVNYIANISDGTFLANKEMIRNCRLDYTSSIYYFVLAPDGRSIKYWAKYTGCYPTTIPYSSLRYDKGTISNTDLSINFIYTTKEDMSTEILEEFNMVSLQLENYKKNFDNQDYDYRTLKNSILLNPSKLIEVSPIIEDVLASDQRPPVVMIEDEKRSSFMADSTKMKLVLSFGNDFIKKDFITEFFGETSFIPKDFFKDF